MSDFQPWDSDHTALVHVLWAAQSEGVLPNETNCDELASRIMRSRWMEATREQARTPFDVGIKYPGHIRLKHEMNFETGAVDFWLEFGSGHDRMTVILSEYQAKMLIDPNSWESRNPEKVVRDLYLSGRIDVSEFEARLEKL